MNGRKRLSALYLQHFAHGNDVVHKIEPEFMRFLYKIQKSKKTFDFSRWTEYNMSIFIVRF